MIKKDENIHRKRGKNLGVLELIAIALYGEVLTPVGFLLKFKRER